MEMETLCPSPHFLPPAASLSTAGLQGQEGAAGWGDLKPWRGWTFKWAPTFSSAELGGRTLS